MYTVQHCSAHNALIKFWFHKLVQSIQSQLTSRWNQNLSKVLWSVFYFYSGLCWVPLISKSLYLVYQISVCFFVITNATSPPKNKLLNMKLNSVVGFTVIVILYLSLVQSYQNSLEKSNGNALSKPRKLKGRRLWVHNLLKLGMYLPFSFVLIWPFMAL